MAERLFYKDQYLQSCNATVLCCEKVSNGWAVTLDQTIFYPTGGGQPCDSGYINDIEVIDVSYKDEEIIHLCSAPLLPCQTVSLTLDWNKRFSLMQQHSGEHIVSGIVHQWFGYNNVGFHMGSDVITIDFNGMINQEQLIDIEHEVNSIIWQDIESRILYPNESEIQSYHYRSKKELSGWVRLVEFGEYDLCACCGLHVSRTGEIGLVKLLSTCKFHDGSRIELLCGKPAMDYYENLHIQNKKLSALLSAKPLETYDAAQRLYSENSNLQYNAAVLEEKILQLIAEQYALSHNVLIIREDIKPELCRKLADIVLHRISGYCAVFIGTGDNFKYCIASKTIDVRTICKELNQALCGRGGGKNDFVQGSVQSGREAIVEFFKSTEV